jgi:imidazolonepropionase-like amidohydrolase
MDTLDARYDAPALLAKAGVRFAIRSGEQYNARNLRFEAGIAAAHGLDPMLALRSVTAAPAELLGLANVGTLSAGAAANIILAHGDPLQPVTRVDGKRIPTIVQIVVRGKWVGMESRQTRLAAQFRDRRAP